jgi:uncharacterized protein (DUF342 family)
VTTAFQPSAFQGYAFQVDPVTGSIYVIDQNDNATLMGSVTGGGEGMDMHDGFHKSFKKLQKKIAKAQEERERLFQDLNEKRKLDIRKIIAPETIERVKESEVELQPAVKKPEIQIEDAETKLNRLLIQQQYLLKSMVQKQAQAQFDAYMAKLRADHEQNLEDEETLLLLL